MSAQNAEFSIVDGKLYIEVNLSQSLGPSKSGKSENLAIVFPPEHIEYEAWPGLRFNLTVSADLPKKPPQVRQRMGAAKK